MELKEGVTLAGLDIKMRPALIAADKIWADLGQELVVTEARGGTHSAGSLHPYGLALDLRIRYFSEETKIRAFDRLKTELGNSFQVVLHKTHIHVEYDT